jgi:hypothetical protein
VVNQLKFSGDGKTLLTQSSARICLWDLAANKNRYERPINSGQMRVALAPLDQTLAVVDRTEGSLHIQDVGSDKWRGRLRSRFAEVNDLAFSPDARLLATIASEGNDFRGRAQPTLRVWETVTGKLFWEGSLSRNGKVLRFAPDGKKLAVGFEGGAVSVWNLFTEKQDYALSVSGRNIHSLAFTTDSKILLVAGDDPPLSLHSVPQTSLKEQVAALGLAHADLESLWKALADQDPSPAYRAMWKLADDPGLTLPFLRPRLDALPVSDNKRIPNLIADLDSNRFQTRKKATEELAMLGLAAEPALRQELASKPSLEVRRRVEQLLAKIEDGTLEPELLRGFRALAVLEWISTRESRLLMEKLAQRGPEDPLAESARSALERLAFPVDLSGGR